MMNKYQIVECTVDGNNAGAKAPQDIVVIADQIGFERILIHRLNKKNGVIGKIQRQISYFANWYRNYTNIADNSILLIQNPLYYKELGRKFILKKLKKRKKLKIISLVHDVEKLREVYYTKYWKNEFENMIELADIIIVHNKIMLDWFVKQGVPEEKLISLQIFDYLQQDNQIKNPMFAKSITIAGNLDTNKCKYIGELKKLKNVQINLFGGNFDKSLEKYSNIKYHGSYSIDVIHTKLVEGFGLVWDGESIDSCRGAFGNYLRYNNPHKLSLYLSSGLPVIIWSEAAEALFVKKYNVGICVNNLYELKDIMDNLTEDKYYEMVANVQGIRSQLISGGFTKKSIGEACKRIIYDE